MATEEDRRKERAAAVLQESENPFPKFGTPELTVKLIGDALAAHDEDGVQRALYAMTAVVNRPLHREAFFSRMLYVALIGLLDPKPKHYLHPVTGMPVRKVDPEKQPRICVAAAVACGSLYAQSSEEQKLILISAGMVAAMLELWDGTESVEAKRAARDALRCMDVSHVLPSEAPGVSGGLYVSPLGRQYNFGLGAPPRPQVRAEERYATSKLRDGSLTS